MTLQALWCGLAYVVGLLRVGKGRQWPHTLFKAAFDALDRSPDDGSRAALLRRVHTGAYDRLAA